MGHWHELSGRQRNERVINEADKYDANHGLRCTERVYCREQRAGKKEGVNITLPTSWHSATAVNAA